MDVKKINLVILLVVGLVPQVGCRSKSESTDKLVEVKAQTQPLTPMEKLYGIKITPDTKAHFYGPNRRDYIADAPISYSKSIEVPFNRGRYTSFFTTPSCEYVGDVIALVQWEGDHKDPKICVNGKRPDYIQCKNDTVEILHVFTGKLPLGEKIIIKSNLGDFPYTAYSALAGGKGALGLVSLVKHAEGIYIAKMYEPMWPESIDNSKLPRPIWSGGSVDNRSAHGVDLPKTFGELDAFFQDLVKNLERYCPGKNMNNIKKDAYMSCQAVHHSGEIWEKYIPGSRCNPEEDEKEDEIESFEHIPTPEEIKAEDDARCEQLGCEIINGVRVIDDSGELRKEQKAAERRKKQHSTPTPEKK